jgi:hypothetical protein
MKRTLWTFGDSFTDSFQPAPDSPIHWRHEYIDWKGYIPKVFGEVMADKLDMNLINKGRGGCDNNHIFEEYCKVCDEIHPDDIVIIGWTNQQRIRLATKNNSWGFFTPKLRNENGFFVHKSMDKFDLISETTIQELLINRESIIYTKELGNWIKLINRSNRETKIIHWSWYDKINEIGELYITGYEAIGKETNGIVDDNHWTESSHYKLADYFIKLISFDNKTKLL